MFSARTFGHLIAAPMVAAGMLFAAPAFAGVVVKSSGPSAGQYPVGTKVGDNDRITLREGDTVTVLSSGGTRVLSGPGTFRAGARGAQTRLRFAQLTRQRSSDRVRTGAARAGSGEVRSPNLWYVDVTKSGTMCLTDLENVTLWRPQVEGEQTFIMGPAATEYHYHVKFEDGTTLVPVDNERLSLKEGNEYTISGPDAETPVTVRFTLVDGAGDNPEGMADTLIEKGCTTQLDLLSSALENSTS